MANVNIKFNNKDYLLSCDDGQEESLKTLTKFLDKKYSELKDKIRSLQLEISKKFELEEKFSQEIEELSQETENLVTEIEKWQM